MAPTTPLNKIELTPPIALMTPIAVAITVGGTNSPIMMVVSVNQAAHMKLIPVMMTNAIQRSVTTGNINVSNDNKVQTHRMDSLANLGGTPLLTNLSDNQQMPSTANTENSGGNRLC